MTAPTKNQRTDTENGSIGTGTMSTLHLKESKVSFPMKNGVAGNNQAGTPKENRNKRS